MTVTEKERVSQATAAVPLRDRAFWVPLAFAVCFAYGMLLVGVIHTTADGSWFWYAEALRSGQHLYSDLHLPLQPVLPIEIAATHSAFGLSWIAQQSVGVVNLLLFLAALASVDRYNRSAAWQRALVVLCGFVTAMAFIMMRFDDFHVLATSAQLGCAALLLRLSRAAAPRERWLTLCCVGVLCGLCILTRVNDGGLLFATVLCITPLLCRGVRERFAATAVLLAGAVVTVVIVLAAIGESPRTWWHYSIAAAASIKGGSGSLLLYPLRLPAGTVREITRDWRTLALAAYALLTAALAWFLAGRGRALPNRRKWALIAVAVLLAVPLGRNFIRGNAARGLVAFAVFGIYLLTATVLVRLYLALRGRPPRDWHATELILLVPCAQLVSISLSAARWYPNTNPPAALLLVLLPVATPWLLRKPQARAVFFTWLAMLTLSAGVDKLRNPFDWFNYRASSIAAPRVWTEHPLYGRMLIEPAHLHLVQPVCAAVDATPASERTLLALPFTYANYMCGVAPWHGYTQTFYDTSSRATIQALERELLHAPPTWIVYQRQLDVLARNEEAFNLGRPLPQRELDTVIAGQIAMGRWSATQLPSPPGDSSTWLLIHTAVAANDAGAIAQNRDEKLKANRR